MSTDVIEGAKLTRTYDSMAQFADEVGTGRRFHLHGSDSWTGNFSYDDALNAARFGWADQLSATMELASSAVEIARKRHLVDSYEPAWDVAGGAVDIGRFVTGEPECMISFPLAKRSNIGSVITLAANVVVSGAISSESIMKRGRLIVALALLLGQLGHSTELWVSMRTGDYQPEAEIAVKVKGVDDVIDPAVIMFAFAHPAMSRHLAFQSFWTLPGRWGTERNRSGMIGKPLMPSANLYPEEAILLPGVFSATDLDTESFLREHLRTLGLLAD
ncbi:hypothetical protein EAS64_33805 [Trebonia kvetii]|uniref:DUF7192 domain-containing protein n=1 Tax=Trebonia kvetii TaxID=2480626 RepID=A0A6P2BRG0_9ACTN|nr:hypothetical protein [Trebonia kvetii]TVZ01257.1 hypothetical protein EAS64_33805 [Trebonia kvetii]